MRQTVEQEMLKKMRDGLKKYGHIMQVHNILYPGVWDTNYCSKGVEVWIEGKYLPSYPKRESTVIKIEHYTPQQRAWGMKRTYSGGKCFMLFRIAENYYLFDALTAIKKVGKTLTKEGFFNHCIGYWNKTINYSELQEILMAHNEKTN